MRSRQDIHLEKVTTISCPPTNGMQDHGHFNSLDKQL